MNTPPSSDETLFAAALERPAAERAAFLDQACAGDSARRARLASLLHAHTGAGDFLESPADPLATSAPITAPPFPPGEKPGDVIGRYKLLQKIGEGGCGAVYLAEQEEPVRRRVALKVIKLGMDTKEVIARFEAERQALALMDHPNIARVFDGGATATGRPFFVMELVRGLPITKYCDEQNLPTAARLELFAQVCHAVQHAHQKGIIHRDLKPSNILVTLHDSVPVPKVIDFGIAKATQGRLTDSTLFTAFEQFIGTPAYMSPEQAELSSLDIDTRSDIYSLGVLLYELLTGRTPFDPKSLVSAGLDEIRRIIREVEPPRPSTRLGTLNDLDRATIAKQRGILPGQLSVLLRGDLDWIVMRCLEKDRTRRYETANGLALDVLRHLHDEPVVARPQSVAYRVGKWVLRNQLAFMAGAAVVFALVTGSVVSTRQAIRATRAERLAQTERTVAVAERRRVEDARNEAETARAREADLRVKAEASDRQAQTEAARSAQVALFMKEMLKGVGPFVARGRDTKLLRDILDATARRISTDLSDRPEVELELRETLGRVYRDIGDSRNAIASFRQALAQRRRLAGTDDDPGVATALADLGTALVVGGSLTEGEARLREALALQKKTSGAGETLTMVHLSQALEKQNKLPEAEAVLRELVALHQKRWGDEHLQVAAVLSSLGSFLHRIKKLDEAETLVRAALAMRRKLVANDVSLDIAYSLNDLGGVLSAQNRFAEAETVIRELVALRRRLGPDDPYFTSALTILGSTLARQRKFPEAVDAYREAVTIGRRLWGNDHRSLAFILNGLGSTLLNAGRAPEAQVALREALAILRSRGLEGDTGFSLELLGRALEREDKLAEAESCYREALAGRIQKFGNEHPEVASSLTRLSSVLKLEGKREEAAAIDRKLQTLREKQKSAPANVISPPKVK